MLPSPWVNLAQILLSEQQTVPEMDVNGMSSSQQPAVIGTMMTSKPTICVARVMVALASKILLVTIQTKVSVTVSETSVTGTHSIHLDVERTTLKTLWLLLCVVVVKVVVMM